MIELNEKALKLFCEKTKDEQCNDLLYICSKSNNTIADIKEGGFFLSLMQYLEIEDIFNLLEYTLQQEKKQEKNRATTILTSL